MDLETELRAGLSARAADIAAPPPGLLDDVLAGHRRSVHRRRGALAAALAVAVVAVALPVGLTSADRGGGTDARAAAPVAFERYPYEPRGSLADDAAYVDGLLTRDWWPSTVGPQPAVDTRQVLFASVVPGGVQALVSGWQDGARIGIWLHGPAGASPQDLELSGEPVPLPDEEAASYLWAQDGIGALVVVARPGDEVELSRGQDIDASGQVVRAPYESVGSADGTAVVDVADLNPSSYGIRVTRDGEPVGVGGGSGQQGGRSEPDLAGELATAAGDPDPDVVRLLVQGVLDRTGLSADQVTVGVRWGGPAGNRTQAADAAVVTVGLPSGATVLVVGAGYTQDGTGEFSGAVSTCGQAILPAGAPRDGLVVARCDLSSLADGASLGSQVVVVPPDGTATIQLTGGAGAVIDTRSLDGPAYAGPAPDGLGGAIALDASGGVVAQAPVLGVQPLQVD